MMLKLFLELKNRTKLLGLFFICISLFTYTYCEYFLFLLLKIIHKSLLQLTYKKNLYFICTDITEIFYVYLKITIYVSFLFSFYYMLFQFFYFFSPGLSKKEIFFFKKFFLKSFICFILSLFFSLTLGLKDSCLFFLNFQFITKAAPFFFEARIDNYTVFCLETSLFFCFSFQILFCSFDIYLLIINYLTIINFKKVKKNCIFSCLFLSFIVGPSDIYLLFFFLLFFIIITELFVASLIIQLVFRQHIKTY